MSFDPLPAPLLKTLEGGGDVRVLELGCGDGRLTRLLAAGGALVVGVDRRRPPVRDFACVVGDVLRPPLRGGAWDLVVAANLLHHLPEAADGPELWYSWLELLAPGGGLYVLEDEPERGAGPAGHYARLQAMLAELPGRGPLLRLAAFRRRRRGPVRVAADGLVRNRYPLDAGRVVDLLNSGAPAPGTEAAQLAADIARDGIAAGSYWWARMERSGTP